MAKREPLIDAALDLAWSHWVGVGVRGSARPPSTAVDPEALLYFTAALQQHDARLRDEAGDWWGQYHARHVSQPRLTALGKLFDTSIVAKLDAFKNAYGATASTSGKSNLDRLDLPARAMLRLRCVFGSNARAEVLLELLTSGDGGITALALSQVGYSKRNVAFVLDDLVMAGVLSKVTEGNRARFHLANRQALQELLKPLPTSPGHWHLKFPILSSFIEATERLQARDATVQGVEARKLLLSYRRSLESLGLELGPQAVTVETYWNALQAWLIEKLVRDLNSGRDRLEGMIEGAWVPPNRRPERPNVFGSAVLSRSDEKQIDPRLHCLDLVQLPTVSPPGGWSWGVLSTAATNVYSHSEALHRGEQWRFATWVDGRLRLYRVSLSTPIDHSTVIKDYGLEAARRARQDKPAVQLILNFEEA